MSSPVSGYHDCPCRDCFEIAIGGLTTTSGESEKRPALCSGCHRAGCDYTGRSDCDRKNAYGG